MKERYKIMFFLTIILVLIEGGNHMILLGFLILIALVCAMVLTATDLRMMMDMQSLLFLLGAYASIIIGSKGWNDFIYGIKIAFHKEKNADKSKVKDSLSIFNLLSKSSMYIIILAVSVELISILNNLSGPEHIGPIISVLLIIPLYTSIFYLGIINPIIHSLKKAIK